MDTPRNLKRTYGQYLSDNVNSFNTVNNIGATDERPQILAWISPLESWKRHHDVSNVRVKGVGEWVLETAEFQAWRDGGDERPVDKTLFGCGTPGAGKTFICSLVVDSLCNSVVDSNVKVACIYCDYREQKEQVPAAMIGGLLRQFVAGLPVIPDDIIRAF
ncbi:hypothetical protein L873DRAFT_37662 [Choiromyces venosus 120613-1]|uniref:Nephrocystin 3-like N-terminal domain-containing protein n=1 Tax=Choiromyces venosus 120613-1 TaxID=1336337 RepID=A0A3N4K402_9PEZI|nr:hypothetical protein L873DRAFT_37662 [Choiromyces venosus 120613-1]